MRLCDLMGPQPFDDQSVARQHKSTELYCSCLSHWISDYKTALVYHRVKQLRRQNGLFSILS